MQKKVLMYGSPRLHTKSWPNMLPTYYTKIDSTYLWDSDWQAG